MAEQGAVLALFEGHVHADGEWRLVLSSEPPDPAALEFAEQALRAIAMVEDLKPDAMGPAADPGLRRLEAKLDLALLLLTRTVLPSGPGQRRRARIGVSGLWIEGAPAMPEAAALHWQPSEVLPLVVHLPVRFLGPEAGGGCWVFHGLAPGLAEALERQIFRLHRQFRASLREA